MTTCKRFLCDDAGQGLVEYALIIALVAAVAITGLTFLGGNANNDFNNVANAMQ
ncbi:MAG: hypothetical protein NVSMB19_14000 [Vulcanimicrobiaceae bacterium]